MTPLQNFNDVNHGKFGTNLNYVYDKKNDYYRAVRAEDLSPAYLTQFNENLVATKKSELNIKPTWGLSSLRDVAASGGLNTIIQEVSGELNLRPDGSTNSYAKLQTLFRGQYFAGTMGECGLGIRIPNAPTGEQEALWGYYDDNNGFGFGANATGSFVFKRKAGIDTKIFQENWSESAFTESGSLPLNKGSIYQINFTWYGYGTIEYFVNQETDRIQRKNLLHSINVSGENSVIDPNLPITVEANYGSNAGQPFDLYVGGRQYSTIGGDFQPSQRNVSETLSNYSIAAAQNVWEPIMAIRPKATFGPSDRANSVRVRLNYTEVAADNPAEYMITFGGNVNQNNWQTPAFWDASETSMEVQLQTGLMTVTNTGNAITKNFVPTADKKSMSLMRDDEDFALGASGQIILLARRTTASATVVSALMDWQEQF